MKKIIGIIVSVAILLSFVGIPVLAQTTTTASFQELIQSLQQQIEALRVRIAELQTQLGSLREVKEEVKEIKETLQLIRQLRMGMTGEDVKLLQEILATDPDVYPEGLVTGYFGYLTTNAVKRFQKIAGIEQVGVVGPKTMTRINELLQEGAGQSGKVPPGLLIAPGIRKKLDFEPKPLPGQELPPGIAKKLVGETPGEDVTAPVISEVIVTEITATSAKITWLTNENADSKVWYDKVTPLVVTTSTPMVSSSNLVLNHELLLSDLTSSTTYYFLVSSSDEADNYEISIEKSFNTLPEGLTTLEQACLNSGGTLATSSCCTSVGDFPNLCLIGACGCSPENSHTVKVCNCETDKCFNGSECVSAL